MFNKKTVFVIGAGASAEFSMPSGEALKNEIASLLGAQSQARNQEYFTRFRSMLMNQGGSSSQTLLEAGKQVAAAMPSFISIDEALHYFSDDQDAVHVGKLAIAYLILDHEAKSPISFNKNNGKVNPSNCEKTWLAEFLSIA